ncbi:MAG: DUF1214 domain-containing protein [Thiogranum sp.]
MVENPINRYSIGDRTKGLKYEKDGSLNIYIQKNEPAADRKAWTVTSAWRFLLPMCFYV